MARTSGAKQLGSTVDVDPQQERATSPAPAWAARLKEALAQTAPLAAAEGEGEGEATQPEASTVPRTPEGEGDPRVG